MANKTGSQIKTMAESYTESDTILDADALLWVNEFLTSNLRDKAGILGTAGSYPNSTRLTRYSLPTGFIREHRIMEYYSSAMADTDFYRDYHDYVIEDDDVYFNDDGHFKLSHFILPTELATIGTAMTVNQVFDKSCALWVAYKYLTNDDEENAKNQSLGQLRLAEYNVEFRKSMGERMNLFRRKHRIRRCV